MTNEHSRPKTASHQHPEERETNPLSRSLEILVVDDEPGFLKLLKTIFRKHGMNVETAGTGKEGLKLLMNKKFDVVVTDITMPEMNGLKLLEEVKRVSPGTEVIVVTGFGAVETAVYAMRQGAFDFVLKPYDLNYLLGCVRKATEEFLKCHSCGKPKQK